MTSVTYTRHDINFLVVVHLTQTVSPSTTSKLSPTAREIAIREQVIGKVDDTQAASHDILKPLL